MVERNKEKQEWNEGKLPKVQPGSGGCKVPGRNTKKEVEKAEKAEEDSREGRIMNEMAQAVVAGIKEKASAHEDANSTAKKISPAKCQATLGLLTNRKRRGGGRGGRRNRRKTRWKRNGLRMRS